LNNILSFVLSYNFALDLPKVIALFATHHILEINTIQIIINNIKAIIVGIISLQNSSLVLSFIDIGVIILEFFRPNSFNESFLGKITISLCIFVNQFSITLVQLRVAIALFQSITIFSYAQLRYFVSN
jgi:hypothetical protein